MALAIAVLCSGCLQRDESISYPFRDEDIEYYQDVAQEVVYPAIATETAEEVSFSQAPHTVNSRDLSDPWDLPLAEAVHIALQNNDIIRSAGQFLSPGNSILANGQNTPSVYDPAISETGVLFGTRGIAAALSAFDTNFTTRMTWGRNEQVQNNAFFAGGLMPGATLSAETGNFQSGLSKDFAYGGQIQVHHMVNYLGSNAPGQLFPSNYTGLLQALYRQPLLAGAGTEYTRIAGPITQSFGGLSGVTQGVVISRINNDISIADFEVSVRNLIKDVQDTYWDLYLAYRNFDTAVAARTAALGTWRVTYHRKEAGGIANFDLSEESQARDQYYAADALVHSSRSAIFTAETRLRRLMGIVVNEGRVIRPIDEPITAEVLPDWQFALTEALVQRVELRKQKWMIKSLELQLTAARSLTKPRLDFVGGYQVNGFGDDLLKYNDNDGAGTAQGLNSFYETLTQGNQTGWSLGFEFNMPIGFRSAHAQVRNIELRLAKARQVLHAQELEIAHELAVAFQDLARGYSVAQSQYNRRIAAIENENTIRIQVDPDDTGLLRGTKTTDEVLRAQERRARADVDFYTALVDYNKALVNLQYRKGTLLADTNVTLLEDRWTPEAYIDAFRHAQARTAAFDAPHKHTEPPEFVSDTPVGSVQFAHPVEPIRAIEQPEDFEDAPIPSAADEATPPINKAPAVDAEQAAVEAEQADTPVEADNWRPVVPIDNARILAAVQQEPATEELRPAPATPAEPPPLIPVSRPSPEDGVTEASWEDPLTSRPVQQADFQMSVPTRPARQSRLAPGGLWKPID